VLGAAVLATYRGSLRQSGSTALSLVCGGQPKEDKFASDTPLFRPMPQEKEKKKGKGKGANQSLTCDNQIGLHFTVMLLRFIF
jgi:hypothetical protein